MNSSVPVLCFGVLCHMQHVPENLSSPGILMYDVDKTHFDEEFLEMSLRIEYPQEICENSVRKE